MDERPLRGYVDVGDVEDFEDGEAERVDVDGAQVALFRSGDDFHALADRCPHAGAPLSEASFADGEIVCSWHAWRFEASTGRCTLVKGVDPVPCHDVQGQDGRVFVSALPQARD